MLWLHAGSDIAIALACAVIAYGFFRFARSRYGMPFTSVFLLFSLFTLSGALLSSLGAWTLWHADYGIEGLIKAAAGILALATAFFSLRIMPRALRLPGPSELQEVNAQLRESNIALHAAHQDLIQQSQERTQALQKANQRLTEEITHREAAERSIEEERIKTENALYTAETARRSKNDFLASISHDIRTPMNVIMGMTHVLAAGESLSSKQRDCVNVLTSSAESLMALLNDVLDISKLETNRVDLEHVPFDLIQLAEEIVHGFTERAKEKSLELVLRYQPGAMLRYVGDPERLRQVLNNLISNAIKFTASGKVEILLSEEQPVDGKTYVTLEVRDTGTGIAPQHLPLIFDQFAQTSAPGARRNGTGLGLAIARQLARLMGGEITVSSVPGRGSAFTVQLKLERQAQPAQRAEESTPPPASNENTPMETVEETTKTLLVVEDWKPNVMVIGMMLEHLGYEYEVAENGELALRMVEKKKYHAILMDIHMPGLDGYQTTMRIRDRELRLRLPRTPIIASTAYAMKTDREKCLAAGMDEYITKPINMDELSCKLTQLLGEMPHAA